MVTSTTQSDEMHSIQKSIFFKLSDKRFVFGKGILSLHNGHPSVKELWDYKRNYQKKIEELIAKYI